MIDISKGTPKIPVRMTPEEVREILVWFIETSTTAMDILKEMGYKGDRQYAVADVLRRKKVKPPPLFPGSAGCVEYGREIADYILHKEQK